jgi:hypothetical protein
LLQCTGLNHWRFPKHRRMPRFITERSPA